MDCVQQRAQKVSSVRSYIILKDVEKGREGRRFTFKFHFCLSYVIMELDSSFTAKLEKYVFICLVHHLGKWMESTKMAQKVCICFCYSVIVHNNSMLDGHHVGNRYSTVVGSFCQDFQKHHMLTLLLFENFIAKLSVSSKIKKKKQLENAAYYGTYEDALANKNT